MSSLDTSALLASTIEKVNQLKHLLYEVVQDAKDRDGDLGLVNNEQCEEIEFLRDQVEALNTFRQDATQPGFSPRFKAKVVKEVQGQLNFSAFVHLEKLKHYATVDDIEVFVTKERLTNLDFVDHAQLTHSLPALIVLPPRVGQHIVELEKNIQHPGGAVDRIEETLQDMRN